MKKSSKWTTKMLVTGAVCLAMSYLLSYLTLWEMPMGGSVTLVSMLPVLFVGIKHGTKWGLGTSLLFALVQLIQGIASGNVFVYCNTAAIVIICALFD